MKELMERFVREEEGQGMVEYGLILALVAVVVITALSAMGTSINDIFNDIVGHLELDS